jgi:cell division protein FtsI (penicillin-binding protein 3)
MAALGRLVPRRWVRRSASSGAPPDWRTTVRARMLVAAVFGTVWAGAIVIRLVQLQVWQHADLAAQAARQQTRTIKAAAKRGEIVDRNGRVLALSADADSIAAVPSEISREGGDGSAATVAKLCGALGDCTASERKTLVERLGRQAAFAYVRRFVEPSQAARVAALNLKGVGFLKESRRFYPNDELAAHVLGYLGTEHRGLGGVEAAYDKLIAGKDGTVLLQTDATGRVFSRTEQPPTAGATIELTLDTYLQHLAERELRAGVAANRASGGSAIIVNPRTGEILAMANEPTFDPNEYRESSDIERRNRAVQDLYEPGSTFKVVTASAAIQERVMPIDTPIDVSSGQVAIGSRIVHDDHRYGVLSFTDVIVKSSNVGAIKIGRQVGTTRLSDYVERFGFGRPTSPDFPGESPGIVWDRRKWTESALASVSMGYQVGVTPLQMVTAVGAIANGGVLMEPRIIGAVYRDGLRYPVKPKAVRRVIDPETAATLTSIMEGVVQRGTGRAAQIEGYALAGKTGTAAKLVDGRYSKQDYNASFVGFVPAGAPALAIIVVIDSPHAGTYYGGSVSAPIFKRIAENALHHVGIPRSVDPPAPLVVTKADAQVARAEVARLQPTIVRSQTPADVVPDVAGMSARDTTRLLAQFGLAPRLVGDGLVVAQLPPAGSALAPGAECRLVLGRPLARHEPESLAAP